MADAGNHIFTETLKEIKKLRTAGYETFGDVDYLAEPVSYSYFFQNYMLLNKLCIIGKYRTVHFLTCLWMFLIGLKYEVKYLIYYELEGSMYSNCYTFKFKLHLHIVKPL